MEIQRKKYVEWLRSEKDRHFIKVLTGIRRCGKSTTLKQFIKVLKNDYQINERNIITYDFNDERLVKKFTWESLINEIESCADPQTMNYVFLDEIQEIKEFEHTIIALFEHTKIQFDIYITGSNSHMFSNELATRLTGRTSTLKIYPLSFKELYENINQNEDVQKFLQRYLIQGGLGIMINDYYHRAKSEETAKLIINDTIEKDVTNRHHIIADIHAFRKIIDFVFIHVGRDINSLNVSRNLIGSNISYKTVFNYITWICEAQILQNVPYYNIKGKQTLKYNSKYYAGDLGILSGSIGFDLENAKGYRLENLVYLELLSRGYQILTGFNHDNKKPKTSTAVDFIAIKDDEKIYLQVTYELNDHNYIRECEPLLTAKNATKKIIITNAMNAIPQDNGIRIVYLTKWLLDQQAL